MIDLLLKTRRAADSARPASFSRRTGGARKQVLRRKPRVLTREELKRDAMRCMPVTSAAAIDTLANEAHHPSEPMEPQANASFHDLGVDERLTVGPAHLNFQRVCVGQARDQACLRT